MVVRAIELSSAMSIRAGNWCSRAQLCNSEARGKLRAGQNMLFATICLCNTGVAVEGFVGGIYFAAKCDLESVAVLPDVLPKFVLPELVLPKLKILHQGGPNAPAARVVLDAVDRAHQVHAGKALI